MSNKTTIALLAALGAGLGGTFSLNANASLATCISDRTLGSTSVSVTVRGDGVHEVCVDYFNPSADAIFEGFTVGFAGAPKDVLAGKEINASQLPPVLEEFSLILRDNDGASDATFFDNLFGDTSGLTALQWTVNGNGGTLNSFTFAGSLLPMLNTSYANFLSPITFGPDGAGGFGLQVSGCSSAPLVAPPLGGEPALTPGACGAPFVFPPPDITYSVTGISVLSTDPTAPPTDVPAPGTLALLGLGLAGLARRVRSRRA